MANAIVDYTTVKDLDDEGNVVGESVYEFKKPKEDQEPHPEGTSWHPILQKYLPTDTINDPRTVDESEVFPNGIPDDE